MKKQKINERGFSLVELIIVIAIMAVLIGISAPMYLKYVAKSRMQVAVTKTDNVVNAVTVVLVESQAFSTPAYEELYSHLVGLDGAPLTNPFAVPLEETDEFGKLVLDSLSDDEEVEGTIYFKLDANANIAFTFVLTDSTYAVDYNFENPAADYQYHDGPYHVKFKSDPTTSLTVQDAGSGMLHEEGDD